MSYISDPSRASVDEFKKILRRKVLKWVKDDFKRNMTLQEIELVIPSILQTVAEDAQEGYIGSINVEDDGSLYDQGQDIVSLPRQSPSRSRSRSASRPVSPSRSRASSVSSQSSQDLPHNSDSSETPKQDTQSYPTFCTPLVRRLSRPYLPLLGILENAGEDTVEADGVHEQMLNEDIDISYPVVNPPISWDKEGIAESRGLRWVKVANQNFQPNDTVYVRLNREKRLHVPPAELPKHLEIGLILYLYLDKFQRPKAHILWFEPASDTSLGNLEERDDSPLVSLAHPQELILTNDCDNVFISQFFGLCENIYLLSDSEEPLPRKDSTSYFYRYYWVSEDDDAFVDAQWFLRRFQDQGQSKSCPCCGEKDSTGRPKLVQDGVALRGVEYHINDFAYIQHEQSNRPYIIGQILQILGTGTKTKIYYHRYHRQKLNPDQPRDDRLLSHDASGTRYEVKVERLQGKCFVIPVTEESYLLPDNCFVCDFPASVRLCTHCGFPNLPPSLTPLKGLDLFSGAGGLSIGLESTKIVNTAWAVEHDESAAKTFQKNHKHAIMYNTCINRLLSQVHACNHASEPLAHDYPIDQIQDFPKRGEVDIIFGGPPCQGFTTLNRQRQVTDQRNQLILSFMSAVDILQPKYVLIENVKELLSFPVGAIPDGHMSFDGGVKRGFLKLIKRLLTGMNYQLRYGILHSGHYGVPQSRRRAFILAAQRGLNLPDLPQPTHVAFAPTHLKVMVNEEDNRSFTVSKRLENNAPLGIITVGDAISDLQRWEWKHPNLSKFSKKERQMHEKRIHDRKIEVIDHTAQPFNVNLRVSGPNDPVPYSSGPMTNYQRMLRENRKFVTQHWSPSFDEKEITRICSIPFRSKKDPTRVPNHNDLPPNLRRPSIYGKKRYDGRYGRLDNDDYFDVSIGRLDPNIDVGRVIHPDLHRILTIREAARSQGFPDHVEFLCVGNSVRRITQQIGNSVPPPMAAAIGREIRKARAKDMEEYEREGSVSL
ncbi:hypothetical protein FRC17_003600 [Serendipita sp. 399]|nr:hypothetical protein FRC17_003600 [Serendipita sp. 399]